MSKMRCTCGHLIIDQTDDLPYKAEIVSDRDRERLWGAIEEDLSELLELRSPEERARWARRRFGSIYPGDLSLAAMVIDSMGAHRLRFSRQVYECAECGTIWIQTSPSSQRFQGYAPHEGNARGVLDSGGVSGRTG